MLQLISATSFGSVLQHCFAFACCVHLHSVVVASVFAKMPGLRALRSILFVQKQQSPCQSTQHYMHNWGPASLLGHPFVQHFSKCGRPNGKGHQGSAIPDENGTSDVDIQLDVPKWNDVGNMDLHVPIHTTPFHFVVMQDTAVLAYYLQVSRLPEQCCHALLTSALCRFCGYSACASEADPSPPVAHLDGGSIVHTQQQLGLQSV